VPNLGLALRAVAVRRAPTPSGAFVARAPHYATRLSAWLSPASSRPCRSALARLRPGLGAPGSALLGRSSHPLCQGWPRDRPPPVSPSAVLFGLLFCPASILFFLIASSLLRPFYGLALALIHCLDFHFFFFCATIFLPSLAVKWRLRG